MSKSIKEYYQEQLDIINKYKSKSKRIDDAIMQELINCIKYPKYKLGVYVIDSDKRKLLFDVILNKIHEKNVERYINSRNDMVIYLTNGSYIKLVYPYDNARGHRFNGVIIDNSVYMDLLDCVIYSSLIPLFIKDKTITFLDNVHFIDLDELHK